MTKADVIKELSLIENAKRVYRENVANFVIQNTESFPYLLHIVFDVKSEYSVKASWVLEIVCLENILLLLPHLDYFTKHLAQIKNESALRPLSKICAFLIKSSLLKYDLFINNRLTKKHKDRIVENSFDWLIEEHKIATQVFAMDTLYYLGKEFDWIHTELKLILQKNTPNGSAGYKAHARSILKII